MVRPAGAHRGLVDDQNRSLQRRGDESIGDEVIKVRHGSMRHEHIDIVRAQWLFAVAVCDSVNHRPVGNPKRKV
jgi:hypothetical protein